MGAWRYLRCGEMPLQGICRAASPSPATGSARVHRQEQQELMQRAFAGIGSEICKT